MALSANHNMAWHDRIKPPHLISAVPCAHSNPRTAGTARTAAPQFTATVPHAPPKTVRLKYSEGSK